MKKINIDLSHEDIVSKAKFLYSLGLKTSSYEILANNGYVPEEILK